MGTGENRIASILLAFCRVHTLSAGELAERLEVSERTVRNDIKQLNEDLKGCAAVESAQGRYTLHVYDGAAFHDARARLTKSDERFNSPRNRMDYIFGRLMRAEAPLLTDDLAYEMSIGRSTFTGDLKKLRAELEPCRLSILGKTSKGLVLQGQETDIRNYILESAYETLYRDYPLDPEITELVDAAFSRSPFEKSEPFQRFLTVMLDRFLTGHPLENLPQAFYSLTARREFSVIDGLLEEIGRFLHVEFPPEEKLFALLPIVGMRTPADAENMKAIELDQAMGPLADEIFRQIRLELNISLERPEFMEEFLYHLMFMINRLRFHVRLKSDVVAELREKYPLAWQMGGVAAQVIWAKYGVEVTEDERSYLASYFGVFLEESAKRRSPFRVAVVCGMGRVTARLVASQLKRVLDSSVELTLLSMEKATPERLAEFGLIFTTVQLPCRTEQPVIFIHEIFNEQDIRHKIEKAKYWDQVDVPVLDNNWFVMVGLLDESRFFRFDGGGTYEEAVDAMVASLTEGGQVDAGFAQRLREREEKGSMAFDHGVAIPHTVQKAGDRMVLAVGVFPQPVRYRDREIQLIFLLGLPEKVDAEDGILVRVYEEIISVAKDGGLMEKITHAADFQALLRALYRQV